MPYKCIKCQYFWPWVVWVPHHCPKCEAPMSLRECDISERPKGPRGKPPTPEGWKCPKCDARDKLRYAREVCHDCHTELEALEKKNKVKKPGRKVDGRRRRWRKTPQQDREPKQKAKRERCPRCNNFLVRGVCVDCEPGEKILWMCPKCEGEYNLTKSAHALMEKWGMCSDCRDKGQIQSNSAHQPTQEELGSQIPFPELMNPQVAATIDPKPITPVSEPKSKTVEPIVPDMDLLTKTNKLNDASSPVFPTDVLPSLSEQEKAEEAEGASEKVVNGIIEFKVNGMDQRACESCGVIFEAGDEICPICSEIDGAAEAVDPSTPQEPEVKISRNKPIDLDKPPKPRDRLEKLVMVTMWLPAKFVRGLHQLVITGDYVNRAEGVRVAVRDLLWRELWTAELVAKVAETQRVGIVRNSKEVK